MKKEQVKDFIAAEHISIVEAMRIIDNNASGILFVVNDAGRLIASLTDGDIRRWLIKTADLNAEIAAIMHCSPIAVSRRERSMAAECIRRNNIHVLPVVDSKGKIIDIIWDRETEHEVNDKKEQLSHIPTIIMAGGKGTRLYPYTRILPKPLIPIDDIPIVERIMNKFNAYGTRDFYMTIHYRGAMIKSYFADIQKAYNIHYVEEEKPLGTAGSIRLIEEKFSLPVFVTNCDILIHADYAELYKQHMESGNVMTVVTALKNVVVPYGVITAKENGIIKEIEEKPQMSYFVNTGMYVVNPEALELIPGNQFFHMTDLVDALLAKGEQVGMYPVSEESFLDMGEFEEMSRMEEKLHMKSEY